MWKQPKFKASVQSWHDPLVEPGGERDELNEQLADEEARLASRGGQAEFHTVLPVIQELLKPGARVLQIGPGGGAYALALARAGYEVTALAPAGPGLEALRAKVSDLPDLPLTLQAGDALDLSRFEEQRFDLVLLLGPLHGLRLLEQRLRCLMEARRVLSDTGQLLITFLNHDMVPMTQTAKEPEWFCGKAYNQETMRVGNRPFVYYTLEECLNLLRAADLTIQRSVAADGFASILESSLEDMSEAAFSQYLKWQAAHCEKPELLGASQRLLFVTTQGRRVRVSWPSDPAVVREREAFLALKADFQGFLDPGELRDGELFLKLSYLSPGRRQIGWVPAYRFGIYIEENTLIGHIDLRVGYSENVYYGGNVGFAITSAQRGKGYAGRACQLIFTLARRHAMPLAAINNEYRNHSSRRVCEKLGAKYQRTVALPLGNDMRGEQHFFENIFYYYL